MTDAIHILNGRLKGTSGESASRLSALIGKSDERFGEPETIALRDGYAAPQSSEDKAEMPTYSIRTPKLRTGFWGKKKSA